MPKSGLTFYRIGLDCHCECSSSKKRKIWRARARERTSTGFRAGCIHARSEPCAPLKKSEYHEKNINHHRGVRARVYLDRMRCHGLRLWARARLRARLRARRRIPARSPRTLPQPRPLEVIWKQKPKNSNGQHPKSQSCAKPSPHLSACDSCRRIGNRMFTEWTA